MRSRAALCALVTLALALPAQAEEVVEWVRPEAVAVAFARNGLTNIRDMTADPQYPSIGAQRADGLTVQATFFACEPERCRGLSLTAPIPAREVRFARIIEGSIERSALGFDAWVQESPPIVVIETYLTFDGGVSDSLLPSTVMSLMSTVDQTKRFMVTDDPLVAEVWPQTR